MDSIDDLQRLIELGLVSTENAFDISHMLLGMDIMYATGKQKSSNQFTKIFVPPSARDTTGYKSVLTKKDKESGHQKHKKPRTEDKSKDSNKNKSHNILEKEKREMNVTGNNTGQKKPKTSPKKNNKEVRTGDGSRKGTGSKAGNSERKGGG